MTFELQGLPQGDNDAQETREALSLEANEAPKDVAQATDAQATDKQEAPENGLESRVITEFTSLPKDGRLGWMMAEDSPANMIKSISDSDASWKEPYRKLTEMDGHRLTAKFDGAVAVIRNELTHVPPEEGPEVMNLAGDYLDPSKEVTPEMDAKLAKYPQIHVAAKAGREALLDPNYIPARELQKQVRDNLNEGYGKREYFAKMLAGDDYIGKDIPGTNYGAAAAVIAFSIERAAMSDFYFEPIYDMRYAPKE